MTVLVLYHVSVGCKTLSKKSLFCARIEVGNRCTEFKVAGTGHRTPFLLLCVLKSDLHRKVNASLYSGLSVKEILLSTSDNFHPLDSVAFVDGIVLCKRMVPERIVSVLHICTVVLSLRQQFDVLYTHFGIAYNFHSKRKLPFFTCT